VIVISYNTITTIEKEDKGREQYCESPVRIRCRFPLSYTYILHHIPPLNHRDTISYVINFLRRCLYLEVNFSKQLSEKKHCKIFGFVVKPIFYDTWHDEKSYHNPSSWN
jgi:hypothetical protein